MEEVRLPKKAYIMLRNLDDKGKTTWATNVRKCLFRYGFGIVWMNQGVADIKQFLRMFKRRMIDCRWQNWNDHIDNSDRFSMYRMICNPKHCVQSYLQVTMDNHLKFMLTKFRFGVSDIKIHSFRYKPNQDLLCPLC